MKTQVSLSLGFALCAAAASNSTYSLMKTIPWSPSAPKSVDQSVVYNNTYYLSDRSHGIHVVDLQSETQTALISGFTTTIVNGSLVTSESGPDGLVLLPDRNELWAGDDKGIVRIVNLLTRKIVANISTGSVKRADEFAYDASTATVVVTNANEDPPYVSVMDANTRTVMGKVMFLNASGLEQPAFNPANGKFYVSVPDSGAYPGGFVAELDLSNPSNYSISRKLSLPECIPAGIVFGANHQLFTSCSSSQFPAFGYQASYILNVTSGAILANVSGVSGVDQVAYSASTDYFYASGYLDVASDGSPAPKLFIIGSDGTIIQSIVTDNSTAHSVAVQASTGLMIVPIKKKGIEIYSLGNSSNSTGGSGSTTSSGSSPSSTSSTSGGQRLLGDIGGFLVAAVFAITVLIGA